MRYIAVQRRTEAIRSAGFPHLRHIIHRRLFQFLHKLIQGTFTVVHRPSAMDFRF